MMSNEILVHNVIRRCASHAWAKRRQSLFASMVTTELAEQHAAASTDPSSSQSTVSTAASTPTRCLSPAALNRLRHEAGLLCQDSDPSYEQQDILSTHVVYQHMLRKLQAALQRDDRDGIHNIRFAAALLLSNGEILTAHQHKVAEYGHSLDAVVAVYALWRDKAERLAQEHVDDEIARQREAEDSEGKSPGCCGQCSSDASTPTSTSSLSSSAPGSQDASTTALSRSQSEVSGSDSEAEHVAKRQRTCVARLPANLDGHKSERKRAGISYISNPYQPLLLLLRDNYGVLHAPFAPARALFAEMGKYLTCFLIIYTRVSAVVHSYHLFICFSFSIMQTPTLPCFVTILTVI